MMAAALALLFAGALAQKRQVMLDKVVAVVGGSSILYSEVDDYARQLTEQRRQEGYTSDRDPMNEALEALMTQKLLYNQAQIDSVKVNDADIMARVEEQVQQMVEAEGSTPSSKPSTTCRSSTSARSCASVTRSRPMPTPCRPRWSTRCR